MQEITLILGRVESAQQFVPLALRGQSIGNRTHPCVVAGGDVLGAHADRVIEEGLELDLGVAQHIRVGRAAGRVLAQEFGEHAIAVFGREIDRVDVDADHVGGAGGVQPVLARRAVLVVIVVFPVLHEQADDFPALFAQQPRRHRRIDTARHADHDPPAPPGRLRHRCRRSWSGCRSAPADTAARPGSRRWPASPPDCDAWPKPPGFHRH